jgi:hypothetical protein
VAIDVDSNGAYVAAGSLRKGQVAIERAVALPDDFAAATVDRTAEMGKKLKDVMKQAGITPAPTIVLVGRDKLFLKDVKYPNVPPENEPQIVRFQAVKDLADNPDDLALDYLPLGPSGDGKRANAVFVKKELLKAAKALTDAAGLKLVAITPRQFAVAEAFRFALTAGAEPPENTDDAVALLYPAGPAAEFVVVRSGTILFSRSIPAPALQSEAALVGELRRNLAVVAGQVPGGATAIYIAEGDAPGGGWSGRLADTLPIPVRTFDPLAGSPAGTAVPPQFAGRFAAPAGAIRLAARPGPLPINFVSPRAPKAEPDKNRSKILFAALAACVLVGLLFAGGFWLLGDAEAQVAKLKRDRETAIESLTLTMTNARRVEAAQEFLGQQVRLHDELYDWADMMPSIENLRASVIDFNLTQLPTVKERKDEEKKKGTPGYKPPPPKPVGSVSFTMQTNDNSLVERFMTQLSNQPKFYVGVKKEGGQTAGTGKLNQTHTVKAGIHARKPDQYTRKLNVTLPKPKPKSADPDDEFGGFPINAEGGVR